MGHTVLCAGLLVLCVVISWFRTVGVGESLSTNYPHLSPDLDLFTGFVYSTSFSSFAATLVSAEIQSDAIYFSLLVQFKECQTPFREPSPLCEDLPLSKSLHLALPHLFCFKWRRNTSYVTQSYVEEHRHIRFLAGMKNYVAIEIWMCTYNVCE